MYALFSKKKTYALRWINASYCYKLAAKHRSTHCRFSAACTHNIFEKKKVGNRKSIEFICCLQSREFPFSLYFFHFFLRCISSSLSLSLSPRLFFRVCLFLKFRHDTSERKKIRHKTDHSSWAISRAEHELTTAEDKSDFILVVNLILFVIIF